MEILLYVIFYCLKRQRSNKVHYVLNCILAVSLNAFTERKYDNQDYFRNYVAFYPYLSIKKDQIHDRNTKV